jgi:tetratricopeptide (TPR) repeat protein
MNWVGMVSGDIPAMAISHNFNRMGATEEEQTNQAVVVAEIQAAVQPAIPAIKVSDWLEKLDGDNEYGVCALNTKPFLDFASYLASIPSSNDAQTQFRALKDAAEKIIKAQNVIDMMLKLQAKQPAIAPDPFAVARNNADQIQGDYARATAINNLIDSEMKAGDVAGAQKTSDLFQNEISSNPGWYYLAQCKIGEAQAKAGDVTGAHETFATALQNINQFDAIKDINSEQNRDNAEKKSTCQVYIAVAQANIGDITDALKTADLIQDVNRKSQALRDIATDQAKAGDIAGAQKTADLIQDANYKSQAQKTIADDQAKP